MTHFSMWHKDSIIMLHCRNRCKILVDTQLLASLIQTYSGKREFLSYTAKSGVGYTKIFHFFQL